MPMLQGSDPTVAPRTRALSWTWRSTGAASALLAGFGGAVAPAGAAASSAVASQASAQHAAALVPDCSGSVENPHWSTNGQSVVVKGRMSCNADTSRLTYHLILWHCPKPPPSTKWMKANCVRAAQDSDSFNPATGTTYTGQAPPPGGPRIARRPGWWVGDLVFQANDRPPERRLRGAAV